VGLEENEKDQLGGAEYQMQNIFQKVQENRSIVTQFNNANPNG